MSTYENLSLNLLACMAHGLGLQLLQPSMRETEQQKAHDEMVLQWQQKLNAILLQVGEATAQAKAP
jgi:hypothetical protein